MYSKYKSDLILGAHFLLGVVFVIAPGSVFYFTFAVFSYGVLSALGAFERQPAYLIAAYLVGFELMDRMSQSGIPHEFVKYAVTILFGLELLRWPKRAPRFILLYGVCLLPAIFLIDAEDLDAVRKLISLNLSGPLCLVVSTIYFYKRPLTVLDAKKIFLNILYPLAAILSYLIIATPDLSEIDFGYQSNFETSIYGPNQMSSILGLGVLIIGLCYLLKVRLFGSYMVAIGLVGLLAFRGLLTFSRGGMIAPLILLTLAFLVTLWRSALSQRHFFRTIAVSIVAGCVFYLAFSYTNEVTDNALYDRYAGRVRGKQIDVEKLTSGRVKISGFDLEIFQRNIVTGVGVGMAKFSRKEVGSRTEIIAHNEFTRLLAEHGLFGAIAILILFLAPTVRFFRSHIFASKIITLTLAGFCLVFMTHSATRLAAPCFLFGLAFLELVNSPAIKLKHTSNVGIPRQYAIGAG